MRPWLLIVLVLAGCSVAPPRTTQSVRPATAAQVARCTYLDDVTGTSSLYGVFAGKGVTHARDEATAKAAALGATHLVWQPAATSYGSTSVNAKAYRCVAAGP